VGGAGVLSPSRASALPDGGAVFGARFVPARTRIILAVAITALSVPLIPAPGIAPFSPQGFVVVFQQMLIGVALGFALQIVFDALGLAGQLLANSMVCRSRSTSTRCVGSSTPALGQLYIILATLTFLALGGHAALIELLVAGLYALAGGYHGPRPARTLESHPLGWPVVCRCDCGRAAGHQPRS
jgi:flagellar biosynthetic protein FliR